MTPVISDEVMTKVADTLKNTPFASSSLKQLSGGTANFIYCATLVTPLEDGTTEVLVKHGEDYIKDNPKFKLTLQRCRNEEECLRQLADLAITGKTDSGDEFKYAVRAPRVLYFDEGNNTQIQEYLAQGIDLKTYALNTYPAHTPETFRPQCQQVGKALGRWLRSLHGESTQQQQQQQQKGLRLGLDQCRDLQQLKHMINFEWLLQRVEQFPAILGDAKPIFEKVKGMAIKELEQGNLHRVIHGDFWTGNVLLPNYPVREGSNIPVFVVDWEMAQPGVPNLDLGQMIAELYELWLYRSIDAGLWMIQGLVESYGASDEDFAFRTAIQVGVHLISFGTSVQGWGTPEQVEAVARTGRDLVVNGWEKRRAWFEGGDLECLFGQVTSGK